LHVNTERARRIAESLAEIGPRGLDAIESSDPQFLSIESVGRSKSCCLWLFYVNALISYKLKLRGEEYWLKFGEFIANLCDCGAGPQLHERLLEEFTRRYNNILLQQKLERLRKVLRCKDFVSDIIEHRYDDLRDLVYDTSRCLRTQPHSKTVLFAAKIYYYISKYLKIPCNVPHELPIPVDIRVAKMSVLSGLLEGADANINASILETKHIKKIQYAWNLVAELSGIPPIRIDSVLWIMGRFSDSKTRHEVYELFALNYGSLLLVLGESAARRLINELFYILPP